MRQAYKLLLQLYPADYRASLAAEMLATFEEASEERRDCGWLVFGRFAFEEVTGVVVGATKEWIARIANNVLYPDRSSSPADAARRLLEKMRTPWVSSESFFKVVDLISDAGICVNAPPNTLPDVVVEAQERVRFVIGRMVNAISNDEYEKVRFYSNEERKERENLRLLLEGLKIV